MLTTINIPERRSVDTSVYRNKHVFHKISVSDFTHSRRSQYTLMIQTIILFRDHFYKSCLPFGHLLCCSWRNFSCFGVKFFNQMSWIPLSSDIFQVLYVRYNFPYLLSPENTVLELSITVFLLFFSARPKSLSLCQKLINIKYNMAHIYVI